MPYLKFLKKFNMTIIGGQNTPTTLNWGYDYTANYTKQAFTFGSSNIGEYGVAHSQYSHPLKCDQDHQSVAEYIVVQGPKELRAEERQEATLAK